jgi:hypothetical protein
MFENAIEVLRIASEATSAAVTLLETQFAKMRPQPASASAATTATSGAPTPPAQFKDVIERSGQDALTLFERRVEGISVTDAILVSKKKDFLGKIEHEIGEVN